MELGYLGNCDSCLCGVKQELSARLGILFEENPAYPMRLFLVIENSIALTTTYTPRPRCIKTFKSPALLEVPWNIDAPVRENNASITI